MRGSLEAQFFMVSDFAEGVERKKRALMCSALKITAIPATRRDAAKRSRPIKAPTKAE